MNEPMHMSPDEFRARGRRVVDWIADYMTRAQGLPVLARVEPGQIAAMMPPRPPEQGEAGFEQMLADLERIVMPGITHWQSPNFFAYFPCNASGPGILGEMLSAGLNVNGMLWATSPAATEVETRVMDWLAGMIGLPEPFLSTSENGGGVIQGTASESALVAMVAARRRMVQGPSHPGELVAYASTQAHSSIVKAAMVAGIADGPEDFEHVRLIAVDDRHAMRPDLLARAMREDAAAGRIPFFVCATVGTTSSTAVDPVRQIGAVIDEARRGEAGRPWLHVDAAHSGSACVCPELRWMLDGVELADSVCLNPHKWLLTNFDCDCFFTSDRASLIDAMSVTPEYLRNAASDAGTVIDYRDWGVPLGRRFRALKLWMVIRHYGVEGLRAHIREHVRLAALFEEWVRADARFEVVAPRTVNLVCFRLRGEDGPNRELLAAINASGKAYLTHTMLADRYVIRMAIGATATQERHVRAAWDLIGELAAGVLGLGA